MYVIGLRAIRIVETEDRGLREQIGGAAAGRMLGVAFDLRRPPLVALDQHAVPAYPPSGIARGEEQRLAGHVFFGLAHVRNDLLVRLLACRRSRRPAPATRPSA